MLRLRSRITYPLSILLVHYLSSASEKFSVRKRSYTRARPQLTDMVFSNQTAATSYCEDYQCGPLWTGPAKLITIRTSRIVPFESLMKASYKEPTGIRKQPREGLVLLDRLGFNADENAFAVQGRPEKAVLQYNPAHYQEWKNEVKGLRAENESRRDFLLTIGGFGENIAVEELGGGPVMDERTMCIGDLVAFRREGGKDPDCARLRLTGPRKPCFKLNHRFGWSDMSQRAQNSGRTGWFYSVEQGGNAQVGDQVVLLERPFPDWPIARIQHYQYKDPKNFPVLEEILATLGKRLVYDIRDVFASRLTKRAEDMSERLQGVAKETFTEYRLLEKRRETDRVSEFVFERVNKLPRDSREFTTAESGSHIHLRLQVPGLGRTQLIRPYSVISGNSNNFRLGIAQANDSRGGSSFLHQNLNVGDVLEASSRFANTFPLKSKSDVKHIFFAGGIGITAFLDHMKQSLSRRQRFHLHYMIRNESDYAFRELIEEILADHSNDTAPSPTSNTNGKEGTAVDGESNAYTDRRLNLAKLSLYISGNGRRCNIKNTLATHAKDDNTRFYICGSEKLSDSVRKNAALLSIPRERLHFEQFSIDTSGDPFVAKIEHSGKSIEVSAHQSLLDALREAGIDVASSCEAGNCATCRVRVKCGRIVHKGTGLPDDEKAGYNGKEEGEMLSCVSRGIDTICLDL